MIKKISLSPRRIALFLWHWLLGGFFLGTLTLTGPVRWTTGYARSSGWSEPAEKAAVFAFIAALAVISVLLARLLTLKTETAAGRAGRYGLPAASLAVFAVSLWFWMNPGMMTDAGSKGRSETFSGAEFVFGPYPEAERLKELKAEGYTAIISLLSPAVVPFEPVLLAKELAAARATGMEVIHIPMLPWISSNDHVEAEQAKLLARGGRYYVHCYLGKDRVNVFKKMLSGLSGDVTVKSLQAGSARSLRDVDHLERGTITRLEEDVFFTPYPTDEEFFGYILNGTVVSLVSLLDPRTPEDLEWIRKEEEIAKKYRLKYANYPWKTMTKAKKEKAVKEISAMGKPLVIHAFLSRSGESSDFIGTYKRVK